MHLVCENGSDLGVGTILAPGPQTQLNLKLNHPRYLNHWS